MEIVNIGKTVKVMDPDENKEKEYEVVESGKQDPFKNKISNESPIGKALIGSKVGERIEYKLPKGDVRRLDILIIA
jgi:transcription elongation factor GreA